MSLNAHRCSPRALLPAALAGLAAVLLLASSASDARSLGSSRMGKASCPRNCLVEARVTAFQLTAGGQKAPFRVSGAGRIVAWSVKLGRPRGDEVKNFTRGFGPSRARLSILKPVRVRPSGPARKRWPKGKLKYRLLRQSPSVKLKPFFGSHVTFAVPHPLKVGGGQIAALTISSWAPVFSLDEPNGSRWRASRTHKHGGCLQGDRANIASGAPHTKPGSLRAYRCVYRGTRLLYSATFVPRRHHP